jgi:hypothetical protein
MADAPSDVHPILDLPSALRLLDIENRHSPSHFAVSSTSSYAEVLEKRKTNSPPASVSCLLRVVGLAGKSLFTR